METIFGLPAHIFFVHVPIVLTPLVCAAAIACALRPQWRRRFGPLLVLATAAIFVSILLAAWSGGPLNDIVEPKGVPTDKHQSLGETARLFAAGLVVSTVGLVGFPWWRQRRDADSQSPTGPGNRRSTNAIVAVLAAATIGFAVLSTVWVVRTGHEGSKIVWTGTFPADS